MYVSLLYYEFPPIAVKIELTLSPTGLLKAKIVMEKKRFAILEYRYHDGAGRNYAQHAWHYTNIKTFQTMLTIDGG